MDEGSSLDRDRSALVEQVVDTVYARLVQAVVVQIKALPENCRQSGDDSRLSDVWEEFKYQLQEEESFFFEVYEETIRGFCAAAVEQLDRGLQQLLWLWTEGYLDFWVEQDEVQITDWENQHVTDELYNRVHNLASNEPLAADPDEERDRDRYEEETDLFPLSDEQNTGDEADGSSIKD